MKAWLVKILSKYGNKYSKEEAFEEEEEEKEILQKFLWKKKVKLGKKIKKVENEKVSLTRSSFEVSIAEIVNVDKAEEVFADEFEEEYNNKVKDDVSGFNLSGFHSSFTSIDLSYQHFKSSP